MAEPVDLFEFGSQLLESNDLDPVYVLLEHSTLEPDKLYQWLLAYWCFYHVGTASWIVDRKDYWQAMRTAAASKDYPRSSERRHFRGVAATSSVDWLCSVGVESLFQPLIGCDSLLEDVVRYIKKWRGFGDWIAFKVADMVERLDIGRVHIGASFLLFDSPQKGASLAWDRYGGGERPNSPDKVASWAVEAILERLGTKLAPPRYERSINAQEAETILCKWKSSLGGHYHVGEDTAACRKGLLRFSRTPTAQQLLRAGNAGGIW